MTAASHPRVTRSQFHSTLPDPFNMGIIRHPFDGERLEVIHLITVPPRVPSKATPLRGRITKQGSGRMRRLLVQAAWAVLRSRPTPEAEILKRWTTNAASPRGRYVAIVALARRLARIQFAVWRDSTSSRVPGSLGGREVTT